MSQVVRLENRNETNFKSKKTNNKLVCFGSPLIDIVAEIQADIPLMEHYSLLPDDAVRAEAKHMPLFQECLALPHKLVPGGSVTNTVRVFQCLSTTPKKACYVGVIGQDDFGNKIKERLEAEQIDLHLVINLTRETGRCCVIISKSKHFRTLVTDLGASELFDKTYLESPILQENIKECNFFYISNFFLGVSVEVTESLIKTAKGKKVIVNLSAGFLCTKYPNEVNFMFKNANVVVGNEKEFLTFAETIKTTKKSFEETLTILDSKIPALNKNRLLIITRAADSVITFENGRIHYYKVDPVEHIVDTNGAGDAFVGGFLAKYVDNYPTEECVRCGIRCARLIVQCLGCDFDKNLFIKS